MEFYESFMKFSFPDEDVFCIEKDLLVSEMEGIKACECVVLINPRVALIEAKTSSPKDMSGDKFKDFVSAIKQKFADSLRLFNELRNKKHGEIAFLRLPKHLRDLRITSNLYLICLIVHGHRIEWLGGLQDAFRDVMRDVIDEWEMKDSQVKVYNEETALENRLIAGYIPKNERNMFRDKDGNMNLEKTVDWFNGHA
jgi:hypothetical protein